MTTGNNNNIKILKRPMYEFLAYCETCRTIENFVKIERDWWGHILYAMHDCGVEYHRR